MNRARLFALATVLPFASLPAADERPYAVHPSFDLSYAGDALPEHQLDVYSPKGVTNAPMFVFFHGGAWRSGDKFLCQNVGVALAGRGIVTAVPNYRLQPQGAKHPDPVKDGAAAVAWLAKNAVKFGGDPGRIAIGGHSAGGHLASMLALDPKFLAGKLPKRAKINACVVIDGAGLDLAHAQERQPSLDDIYRGAFGDPAGWAAASPVSFVKKSLAPCPFLFVWGEKDELVPFEDTAALMEKLREAGTRVELERVPGQEHFAIVTGMGTAGDDVTPRIARFILGL
ncbi:MAG: alpha/beta hydrolase [Verrucomicrobiae bacterium]|nr:alpha/beta hydrolase [Verrucomicrobiae bacterium]